MSKDQRDSIKENFFKIPEKRKVEKLALTYAEKKWYDYRTNEGFVLCTKPKKGFDSCN
jgi:hypothetical protein